MIQRTSHLRPWRLWQSLAVGGAALCLVVATVNVAEAAPHVTAPAPPWQTPASEPIRLATGAPGVSEQDSEVPKLPGLTFWTLFAWELGTDPEFEPGAVFELGAELGLPWRVTDVPEEQGLIPLFSVSFAGGFRGYTYRDNSFQSWSTSVTALPGLGIEYPSGTLLFGGLVRWELAFRPLRTAPGETPMIGANGIHSFSLGAYLRFMIYDDALLVPLPIGLYIAADLASQARREVTIAVDLGGLIILGALAAQG